MSLRTLLLAVAVLGLGFAAIASGDRWTVATFFTVVAAILIGVSLRAALSEPRDRKALGFAVGAWSYFAISQSSHGFWMLIHVEVTKNLVSHVVGMTEKNAVELYPRYSAALTCAHCLWMLAIAGIGAVVGQRCRSRKRSTARAPSEQPATNPPPCETARSSPA